jgi:predicted DNA-binding transcriptional regulator YafY
MAIVQQLQQQGMMRAEDLAALFATSVRTIYRDALALSKAGIPIYGSPGRGYSLAAEEFLAPVSFTGEEAMALLLGSDWIEEQLDHGYRAAAQKLRSKVEAVLPLNMKRKVNRQRAGLRLAALTHAQEERETDTLSVLRSAIVTETAIQFRYDRLTPYDDGSSESVRSVDPYGLVFASGAWSVIGHCHLRQDIRQFRVERISDLEREARTFQRPADFQLRRYKSAKGRSVVIQVRFQQDAAKQVKDNPGPDVTGMTDTDEGLLVTLHVRQVEDAVPWLLGWGTQAEVLEPQSLRAELAQVAKALTKVYVKTEEMEEIERTE